MQNYFNCDNLPLLFWLQFLLLNYLKLHAFWSGLDEFSNWRHFSGTRGEKSFHFQENDTCWSRQRFAFLIHFCSFSFLLVDLFLLPRARISFFLAKTDSHSRLRINISATSKKSRPNVYINSFENHRTFSPLQNACYEN